MGHRDDALGSRRHVGTKPNKGGDSQESHRKRDTSRGGRDNAQDAKDQTDSRNDANDHTDSRDDAQQWWGFARTTQETGYINKVTGINLQDAKGHTDSRDDAQQ